MKQKFIVLQRNRTALRMQLKALNEKRKELRARRDELQAQVDAVSEDEEVPETVVEAIDTVATEIEANSTEIDSIEDKLDAIEEQLVAMEDEQPATETAPEEEAGCDKDKDRRSNRGGYEQRGAKPMNTNFVCRSRCFRSQDEMQSFYQRSTIKNFLENIRSAASKRDVSGAQLNIPDDILGLIRENIQEYSKLITKVRYQPVKGKSRMNILGKIPDAVWTEMVADLNELKLSFNQVEMDGYELGGYVFVPNAYLQDSDINLGEEIISALLVAQGKTLDKAIVYGKGPSSKMPVGIATRLAETSQPSYWGSNQGIWTDLHSSHVLSLNIGSASGASFFQPLMAAMSKAEPDYSTERRTTWICNRATHMDIISRGLCFTDAGALVAGLKDQMPVEGGDFVELEFMSDNDIIGGYLDCYILAEREGAYVDVSDQPRWLSNQTGYKVVSRYDGKPALGEPFVAMNINNSSFTTTKDFEVDYANTKMNVLVCTAAAHASTAGKTVVTVSGAKADSPTLKYGLKIGYAVKVGDTVSSTDFSDLVSGTTAITAAAGTPITVVELDSGSKVVSLGTVLSVPKA